MSPCLNEMDAVTGYKLVTHAIAAIPKHGIEIGEVVNGERVRDRVGDKKPKKLEMWRLAHCELGAALAAVRTHSTFCMSGEDDNYLQLKLTDGFTIDFSEDEKLEELKARCQPAMFGDLRSQTTVLDTSVRQALELPASQFKLETGYDGE
eukprot:TRINITY_DN3214_c0_g3_i1.p3 TRINITY_DN3214_c0_g3~~TRINITY_DN3214_c0_g3_i1.p3  ORF type:complete len:150 (-),score=35.69 TRINITY_DN3214_c0_g3_i1:378-827(-)